MELEYSDKEELTMARGESPYQGRYNVPIHDYSPIVQGGAAWGQAYKDVGASIGAGIEKYQLNKQERLKTEASIEGLLAEFPQMKEKVMKHPEHSKELNKMIEGKSTLQGLRQLNSFMSGNMAGQAKRLAQDNAAMAKILKQYEVRDAIRANTPAARKAAEEKRRDEAAILRQRAQGGAIDLEEQKRKNTSVERARREREEDIAYRKAIGEGEENQARFAAQDRLASALHDPRFRDVTTPDQARVAKKALAALGRENPRVLEATQYKNMMENFEDLASTPLSREEQQAEFDDMKDNLPDGSSASITWSRDDGFWRGTFTATVGKEKAEIRPVRMEVDGKMVPIPNVFTAEGREGYWRYEDGDLVQAGSNKPSALNSERMALERSIGILEEKEIYNIVSNAGVPMTLPIFRDFKESVARGDTSTQDEEIEYDYLHPTDDTKNKTYTFENPWIGKDTADWYKEASTNAALLNKYKERQIDLVKRFMKPQTAGIPVPTSAQPPAGAQPPTAPRVPTPPPTPTKQNALNLIRSGQLP